MPHDHGDSADTSSVQRREPAYHQPLLPESTFPAEGQSRRTFLRYTLMGSAAAAATLGAGATVAASPLGPRLLAHVTAVRQTASSGGSAAQVQNGNDSGPGSLRQAILDAQSGDTITFAADVTHVSLVSPLGVQKTLKINGPGADVLTISGGDATQGFLIFPGVEVTLSGLTISNCYLPRYSGAAISNAGTLTLSKRVIANNFAGNGAGLANLTLPRINAGDAQATLAPAGHGSA